MTPIQFAFLKAGWIQVGGADIPVFFKYEEENEQYPFDVIFTIDAHAYYNLYNEWVGNKLLPFENINIEPLVASAFEHLRAGKKMFHIGVMTWLSDFYYHQSRTDYKNQAEHIRESENYRYIYQYLAKLKNPDFTFNEKIITKPDLTILEQNAQPQTT
jgi:hypothetical protein